LIFAWLFLAGAALAEAPRCTALEKRVSQAADPDARLWNEVARCRIKAGQLGSAAEALESAIGSTSPSAEDSDEPEAIEETIRQAERALLKATPSRAIAEASKSLARRSLTMGNYERAHRLFERSLEAKGAADEYAPADWNLVALASGCGADRNEDHLEVGA